jgi:hypothetical protein
MRNLLGKITWLFTALFGLCIAPVIGQFFVELAEGRGAYRNPTEKAELAVNWFAQITESWWFALALGYVAGTAFTLWIVRILKGERVNVGSLKAIGSTAKSPFDASDQKQLIKDLKDHSSEHARLKIMIADIKYRPLADTIESLFHLAGWKADLADVP